jgi:hypothetical protein
MITVVVVVVTVTIAIAIAIAIIMMMMTIIIAAGVAQSATGYGLDDRGLGVRFPVGLGILLLSTASRQALGTTQPPIQWYRGVRLTNHLQLVPSSKNALSYTSNPSYAFMACSLLKHRNNFTFNSRCESTLNKIFATERN